MGQIVGVREFLSVRLLDVPGFNCLPAVLLLGRTAVGMRSTPGEAELPNRGARGVPKAGKARVRVQ